MPSNYTALERLEMLSKGSGLIRVDPQKRTAEQVALLRNHPWRTRLHAYLHAAGEFQADWVYFRLSVGAGAPRPELFIFDWQNKGLVESQQEISLAKLYHHLWNYGRVPLALILRPTTVDIYNLLPPPDFDEKGSPKEPHRIESLSLTAADSIALAAAAAKGLNAKEFAWKRFSAKQFDNGAFWEAEENLGLATGINSLDAMVSEMREVRQHLEKHTKLNVDEEKKNWFVRRLLIITLMVRFLEDRKILPADYFRNQDFLGAENFTSLLLHPRALLRAISRLEHDFNGDVFHVEPQLTEILSSVDGSALIPIANFATGIMEGEQQHFWERYNFKYLPVEVISYIYEDFLGGKSQAYFTPHHLVDLLLDEAMPEKDILNALNANKSQGGVSIATYPVLDPACGSGVFLVGAWRRLVDAFRLLENEPSPKSLKMLMIHNLFGADIEKESVELTIFSLCVALCSEFPHCPEQPSYVFDQLKALKFPNLKAGNIFNRDFFACRESFLKDSRRFRLIIGNPPFESELKTEIQRKFDSKEEDEDGKKWSPVPDNQISYLFLRGVIPLIASEGMACLIQPAGLIYNERPASFRKQLFSNWHVSQVLDFASISGLFTTRKKTKTSKNSDKGSKVGVKTVAVFVRRTEPAPLKPLLHATFRRTSVLKQRQVFEIDPQDLHWIPRSLASAEPRIWKANLLGGGRLLEIYQDFMSTRTLAQYLDYLQKERNWVCGEGLIEAPERKETASSNLPSKPKYERGHRPNYAEYNLLDTEALTESGIRKGGIKPCGKEYFIRPRDERLFAPPHILIKEHESLPIVLRKGGERLLFRHKVIGIAAPEADISLLEQIYDYLKENRRFVEFFAAFGAQYLIGRQAALLKKNIMDLPYPEGGQIVFRGIQKYLRDDVVNFMIPLIKDTDEARQKLGVSAREGEVENYAKVFGELMRSVYPDFRFSGHHDLDTGWCVVFHKGRGSASNFGNVENLRRHIDALLNRETGKALRTWRIVRHFSGNDLFIIKPKPRRYWLKLAAVNDADQTFVWLMKKAVRKQTKERTTEVTA